MFGLIKWLNAFSQISNKLDTIMRTLAELKEKIEEVVTTVKDTGARVQADLAALKQKIEDGEDYTEEFDRLNEAATALQAIDPAAPPAAPAAPVAEDSSSSSSSSETAV